MLSEFDIVARFFTHAADGAVLGVGDDCALLQPSAGMELAVSTDMLAEGRHFFADADPYQLGHKALAVNLSDIAAMGAIPRWATLALALPRIDERWIDRFAEGFMTLARRFDVALVGGDTTCGALNICVTILGEVAAGTALRRDGARVGDDIWVSGILGDAALALAHLQARIVLNPDEIAACLAALHAPEARVAFGQALAGIASAAIDISDGLAADLGHILERSRVGATIEFAALPKSATLTRHLENPVARDALLAGGDDYELCFTAPASKSAQVLKLSPALDLPLTRIGRVEPGDELRVLDESGRRIKIARGGFDHFA